MLTKISPRLWALFIMAVWGGAILYFGLVRFTPYGLDEGAAIALLLNWSVSDMIANPVTTFGGPDFRAFLFIPLGMYWSGSMVAAKVFTLMVTFSAALFLFNWTRRSEQTNRDETALIATGLLLIAPIVITQADAIGVAPYLIALFGLGWVLDQKYRASEHTISSLYFLQMLLVATTITLHPMGLAYPIALAWRWHKDPKSQQQKKQVWLGIAVAAGIILAMQTGWIAIEWFANPLESLSHALIGHNNLDPLAEASWIPGLILGLLLLIVLWKNGRGLLDDLLGSSLLAAVVIGLLLSAGDSWALLALVLILYRGTPLLIQLNQRLGSKGGFVGQRGLVMVVLFISATVFMQADKAFANLLASGLLSPSDELIQALALEADDHDQPFLAASQWPARSLIASRRDVLPLPPAAANGVEQLKIMKGITHIIFAHNDPKYSALAHNLAEMTGYSKTLAILPGGVLVAIIDPDRQDSGNTKAAAPVAGDNPALPSNDAPNP